jgi:hypothetical protein
MIEPDFYHDNLAVGSFSLLSQVQLDNKVDQYGDHLQRQDLMPRARYAGNRVLDHLLFEYGYRDGIYDEYLLAKVEDETCDIA